MALSRSVLPGIPGRLRGQPRRPFAKADIPKLCSEFYAGIGLPVDRVLANSSLTEKGEEPHAFYTDIDREGDVRVLANIVNNEYWMGTMLHELGHAVYSSLNIPKALPYLLRAEAHPHHRGRGDAVRAAFSKSRPWLEKMGVKIADGLAFERAAVKVQRINCSSSAAGARSCSASRRRCTRTRRRI